VQNKGQQQFDLGSFSHEPKTDYAAAERYGQQSLPGLSQPAKKQRTVHATSGPGVVPQRPPGAPETSKPQQLAGFMSQRQIMRKYQPLDADRQEFWDPREGAPTNRKFTTIGNENPKIRTSDRAAPFLQRQDQSAVAKSTHYRDFGQTESLGMMMDRKLEESQMPYDEYREAHGGGGDTMATPSIEEMWDSPSAPQPQTGHTDTHDWHMHEYMENKMSEHHMRRQSSLYEDVAHSMRPGGEGFTGIVHLATGQFGSAGKPQIAGAHHRLAILGEVAPDRLLPVIHHEKMGEARHGKSAEYFKYT